MTNLTGKVALVTGAGRGIGRAVAIALAQEGLDVAVNYRARGLEAQEVVREVQLLGRKALAVPADVAIGSEVARMVATVRDQLGPVDVLVNNAGSARPQAWREIQEADWRAVLDNNLTSAFLVTQTVLPEMCARRWGRIVNISSGAVQMGGGLGPRTISVSALPECGDGEGARKGPPASPRRNSLGRTGAPRRAWRREAGAERWTTDDC